MSLRRLRPLVFLLLCAACAPLSPASPQPSSSPSALPLTPSDQPIAPAAPRSTVSPAAPIEINELFHQVERLRGIESQREIPYAWVTQTEIASLTQQAFLLNWPLAALEREVRLLQRFGLSEPPMDLGDLMGAIGVRGASVAPADDGLVLRADLKLAEADLLQVVCTYEQLLLRQAYPDEDPSRRMESCLANVDGCLARRSLYAGDAALLAEQWLRTFGVSSPAPSDGSVCISPQSATEAKSPGLVPSLTFPEVFGVEFARALFLEAGWAGVDQAYTNPPISTEQILHPERYPKDAPRPPVYPDPASALGADWTTDDMGALGEWRTRLVLSAYLDLEQAVIAAEGWDGDQYALLTNNSLGSHALALHTRWDTVRDAHEFSGAFRSYGESRFGPAKRTGTALTWTTSSGIVILDVGNDQTLWIEAPDAATAAALRDATGFPLY